MPAVIVEDHPISFRALALDVREAGLLDRRRAYYRAKIGFTIAAAGAAWAGFVLVGNSWATLWIAAILGITFTQLGFLGHDAGHRQIFSSRRANCLLGLIVGNALIGLSFGWWVSKHSAHHAHPNEIGRDPDIGDVLPVARPAGAEQGRFNVARFLTRWQAQLFFPMMLFRSTGLHVLGTQRLLRRRDREAAMELALVVLHTLLYFTIVLWVLSPVKALAFIVVQQAVFSVYLGCSFAPNHKGMPIIPEGAPMDFAVRQVVTARNVTGGRLVTFMLGGLNFQIEHHLFPSMPRPNLRRARILVRAFSAANCLEYCEDSIVGSFDRIVHALQASLPLIADPAISEPRGALAESVGFGVPRIADAVAIAAIHTDHRERKRPGW